MIDQNKRNPDHGRAGPRCVHEGLHLRSTRRELITDSRDCDRALLNWMSLLRGGGVWLVVFCALDDDDDDVDGDDDDDDEVKRIQFIGTRNGYIAFTLKFESTHQV